MPRLTDNEAIDRRLKEMQPEDKAVIDEAMTNFVNRMYNVHRQQIAKRLCYNVDDDIISELQQKYYVWMYTKMDPKIIRESAEPTKRLQKIFSFLVNHPSIFKMKSLMLRGIISDIGDEEDPISIMDTNAATEQEETFTNGHLNRDEDIQVKKDLYSIARKETIDWLADNPDSNTAIAVKNTLKRLLKNDGKRGPHFNENKVKEELIDYITAPNINFHRKILSKKINQNVITMFREEFASLYSINGGRPVQQSQLPTSGWN